MHIHVDTTKRVCMFTTLLNHVIVAICMLVLLHSSKPKIDNQMFRYCLKIEVGLDSALLRKVGNGKLT